MKSVLLSVCLVAAAVSAPTPLYPTRVSNLEGDVAMGTAIPSSLNCIHSTQIAVLQADQHEVHAVVVDMPSRASLEHASPENWDTLPTTDPPYEPSQATTVLQVAMNQVGDSFKSTDTRWRRVRVLRDSFGGDRKKIYASAEMLKQGRQA
jgi:hypothetical protein